MRAQFVLSEIGVGLRRNLTMTIAVVVSVALSLALFGGTLLMRDQVNSMKDYWYDKVNVSLFLCNKADAETDVTQCAKGAVTAQQKKDIEADLKKLDIVQSVVYESQDEAYKHYKDQYGSHPDGQLHHPRPDAGVLPGQAQGPAEVQGGRHRLRRPGRHRVGAGPARHPGHPLQDPQRHERGGPRGHGDHADRRR